MICRTTKEFQNKVLEKITFTPHKRDNHIIYKNESKPELGYFIKYSRKGYYDFSIGDYTIFKNFSLGFNHDELLIRFGTVYSGETRFKIKDNPESSFSPSSFFILENKLEGFQDWTKGQHFNGAEITIYKRYFDEILNKTFPHTIDFTSFIENHTYCYLPNDIAAIVQNLKKLAEKNLLTPIYLESKILECIALLQNDISTSDKKIFTNHLNLDQIKIGKNRIINLSSSDIDAIQKAHNILTDNICNPPTIKALSKTVLLNEQKLKSGFKKRYHMSIREYTNSIKMSLAENLLSTTEISIDEISKKLGYNHSSNFVNRFKKTHNKTPLEFRKLKKRN